MPAVDGAPETSLRERLGNVRAAIDESARSVGRDPADISTIVVTKFHPESLMRELIALGVRDVGESRHQEAALKAASLADLDLTWHFVGQLQSKKARAVLEYSRIIHSVDRESLVDALAGTGLPVTVFLQINLTDDPTRGGIAESALEPFAERVLSAGNIRLAGLMAVAPRVGDPRVAFRRVRAASERLRRLDSAATALSMGMSGDFREAIVEGATHLRIGSAITGNRPTPG